MTEHYPCHIGCFLLGRAGLLVSVLAILVLRQDPVAILPIAQKVPVEPPGQKSLPVTKTPTALSLIVLAFALSLTSWPTPSWVPTYLFQSFKLRLTCAGSIVSLFAA